MGKDDVIDYINSRRINDETISFLNNNKMDLLKRAVANLKKQKKYLDILEDKEKLIIIRDSIINGHFQWITDHCSKYSTKFTNEYRQGELDTVSLYHLLYNEMIKEMKKDTEQIEKNLEEHFQHLLKNII